MNWYYAESGQQRGPVTDDELRQKVVGGVIRPETLVWNETLPNWQPWSAVAPADLTAVPSLAPVEADGQVRCTRCQQVFPAEELVEIAGRRVCGACKPLLLQQLQEGGVRAGATEAVSPGTLPEAEFLARDYSLDASSAVSEGWKLMFEKSAVVWLGCLLLWAAFIGASMGFAVIQFIPFLGVLASTVLNSMTAALVEAGNGILYVRQRRGVINEVTSGFGFFGPRFFDIILTALPQVAFGLVIAFGIMALGLGTASAVFTGGGPGFGGAFPTPEPGVMALLGVGAGAFFIIYIYIYTHLRYAPLLVLDKGYRWNDALRVSWRFVHKHFWQNFWLMFLGGLVMMAGACVCLIGAIVSYPLAFGMVGVVYDRHFRDLAPANR